MVINYLDIEELWDEDSLITSEFPSLLVITSADLELLLEYCDLQYIFITIMQQLFHLGKWISNYKKYIRNSIYYLSNIKL